MKNLGKSALAAARKGSNNVVIFDTAGRLQIDDALMKELATLRKATAPEETRATEHAPPSSVESPQ